MTDYLRPIALVYGPDAAAQVAAGLAAPLAGLAHIAFTQGEWITRADGKITRRFVSLNEARQHPSFAATAASRPDFGPLSLSRCHVMGILNVTPDSFSDGGVHFDASNAVAEAQRMIDDGASVIDIGGESTRPGSEAVSLEDERARVLPVIAALTRSATISLDTRKATLMAEGLKSGAAMINDVSALRYDKQSAAVVAKVGCPVILMHAQGDPKTMQLAPKYQDVALDVYDELAGFIAMAEQAGIERRNIMVDVGIGFGKSFKQNLELLQQLALFHGLGVGLLMGLSRKGFIGAITAEKVAAKRGPGSLGGALASVLQGVQVLRVHDVKETVTALQVLGASLDPASIRV